MTLKTINLYFFTYISYIITDILHINYYKFKNAYLLVLVFKYGNKLTKITWHLKKQSHKHTKIDLITKTIKDYSKFLHKNM